MHLSSINLTNFRCFGNDPSEVSLRDLTALIGANGTGKSSVLVALTRLFGNSSDRKLLKSDFHLPQNTSADAMGETSLSLEVKIELPELGTEMQTAWEEAVETFAEARPMEADTIRAARLKSWSKAKIEVIVPLALRHKLAFLRSARNKAILEHSLFEAFERHFEVIFSANDDEVVSTATDSLPDVFRQMLVDDVDATPYCRVRLDATWSPSLLAEGDIQDEEIYWITTSNDEITANDKHKMSPHDRALIQVLYVPAVREPAKQLRQVAGTLMHRLFKAVHWSEATKNALSEASETVATAFQGETAVETIQEAIGGSWKKLHEFRAFSDVSFRPIAPDIETVLKNLEVIFTPGEAGVEHSVDRLSDGLKSLFYLSLVAAVFRIEESIRAQTLDDSPFDEEQLHLPQLTIFAVEEIENHLSPHYLGKILALLDLISASFNAQVVISSQSPAILKRIAPTNVRHFRLDANTQQSKVASITLPDRSDGEVYKYVKEAVTAYPELYFSRLVILGEGDSEEIVLPRLLSANGSDLDSSFISVVPLGGRHVNHFWKLLEGLGIPFITLLDLDTERYGGFWGRVKYACDQLIELGYEKTELRGEWTEAQFDEMASLGLDDGGDIGEWLVALEVYNVFFSAPLDLDYLMLEKFPEAYKNPAGGAGPQVPTEAESRQKRLLKARRAVLKDRGGAGTTYPVDDTLMWYSYLFLGKGKPSSHIIGINALTDYELVNNAPDVLKRLVAKAKILIQEEQEPG